MSIEATAWLDGETTDTLAGGSPATPADPTPWGGDELDSSAALPEIVPEGEEPTPVPPTDPTPWPTDGLVAGGGTCCCPVPPTTCYCPMADVVCVTITGLPSALLGVTGEPLNINGTWTYTYGSAGRYPDPPLVGWFPSPFYGVETLIGTSGCHNAGYPDPGTNQPAVVEHTGYGRWSTGFTYPMPGSPMVSCTQRDGSGSTSSYTYFDGQYNTSRVTVTACQDNRYPGGSPLFGLSYDWNLEYDLLFAGWTPATLDHSTAVPPPGYGGAGGRWSVPYYGVPPAPTVVSCTADELVLTIPWTRWRYREDGIRTRTAFYAPMPAEHNGTVVTNEITTGTATVTINRGGCLVEGPEGGGGSGMGAAMRTAAALHPKAAELMAADPLNRPGCCG